MDARVVSLQLKIHFWKTMEQDESTKAMLEKYRAELKEFL